MLATLILSVVVASGAPDKAPAEKTLRDAPQLIAEGYLEALAGRGDANARNFLLGGISMTAESYTIPNWEIIAREELKTEVGAIPSAKVAMKTLDDAGFKALAVAAKDVGRKEARAALEKTAESSKRFQAEHPLFAYMARTGKDVYWHPKNPWRKIAKKLGNRGKYTLEMHLFRIEEREKGRMPRVWPLRVIRVQGGGFDSGWKILPASDWDPDY